MRKVVVVLGVAMALVVACGQSAPTPAAPAGGGAAATATRPAGASGGQSSGGSSGAASADRGKALVTEKGCIACHVIKSVPGAVGTIGPELDGMGDTAKRPKIVVNTLDNTADNLKKWLANPPAVRPGTAMPNLSLSQTEVDSLVAFLQTLK
ncbi:MAG: c-type cytochrome [Chloroflexi bacterium]|nr:c-type cytochrome [Chloroflexota bacterium]